MLVKQLFNRHVVAPRRLAAQPGLHQGVGDVPGSVEFLKRPATLDAVLERITYANQETGYTVARVATNRSSDPGESLRLQGRWASHPQYGRQFQVETYQTMLPATIQGIRRYLGSGLIKGIGPKMAERIVDHFGQTTLEVIEQKPGRLVEVPGLGPKAHRAARPAPAMADLVATQSEMRSRPQTRRGGHRVRTVLHISEVHELRQVLHGC